MTSIEYSFESSYEAIEFSKAMQDAAFAFRKLLEAEKNSAGFELVYREMAISKSLKAMDILSRQISPVIVSVHLDDVQFRN